MDKEKLQKLRDTAKRTLKILDELEQGRSSGEIVKKLGVDRSLVDYYKKHSDYFYLANTHAQV